MNIVQEKIKLAKIAKERKRQEILKNEVGEQNKSDESEAIHMNVLDKICQNMFL